MPLVSTALTMPMRRLFSSNTGLPLSPFLISLRDNSLSTPVLKTGFFGGLEKGGADGPEQLQYPTLEGKDRDLKLAVERSFGQIERLVDFTCRFGVVVSGKEGGHLPAYAGFARHDAGRRAQKCNRCKVRIALKPRPQPCFEK